MLAIYGAGTVLVVVALTIRLRRTGIGWQLP